ncbi:hypothetical protein IN842_14555 [Mycobacteroides abscessus subsp. abscessus]|uniref:hypothetical protein n=1 Tax=Mycobacteroides abscessus TaxID=36809 RepID=UPI0019D1C416|nr:hypothetical protein [Mycobacteroides abscessus]QSM46254.1 hypothetical protein IN842_14555 [Mycobacteroides abscessus subsp. abscessus]
MSPATKPQRLQKLHQLYELTLSDPETAHSQADDHRVRYVNDPYITAVFTRCKGHY